MCAGVPTADRHDLARLDRGADLDHTVDADLGTDPASGDRAALVAMKRVIFVTRHARPCLIKRALAAGARGFVPKSTPAAQLAVIIRGVLSGNRYIDASIAAAALTEDESPLTIREWDVLRVTRAGLSTKQIANQLHLAHGTG